MEEYTVQRIVYDRWRGAETYEVVLLRVPATKQRGQGRGQRRRGKRILAQRRREKQMRFNSQKAKLAQSGTQIEHESAIQTPDQFLNSLGRDNLPPILAHATLPVEDEKVTNNKKQLIEHMGFTSYIVGRFKAIHINTAEDVLKYTRDELGGDYKFRGSTLELLSRKMNLLGLSWD